MSNKDSRRPRRRYRMRTLVATAVAGLLVGTFVPDWVTGRMALGAEPSGSPPAVATTTPAPSRTTEKSVIPMHCEAGYGLAVEQEAQIFCVSPASQCEVQEFGTRRPPLYVTMSGVEWTEGGRGLRLALNLCGSVVGDQARVAAWTSAAREMRLAEPVTFDTPREGSYEVTLHFASDEVEWPEYLTVETGGYRGYFPISHSGD